MRLFYVATTRARDLLVLSGDAGKGWRREVDGLLAEDPDALALLRPSPSADSSLPGEAPPPMTQTSALALPSNSPPLSARPSNTAAAPLSTRALAAAALSLRPPTVAARLIVAPVTELADFAECPRRYQLRHELGLSEFPALVERRTNDAIVVEYADGDSPTAPPGAPGPSAAARGTLAHAVLEQVDFAAFAERGPGLLRELAEAVGHDPAAPGVAEVLDHVSEFLESPFGRSLARRPHARLRREVPFALAVGPRGQQPNGAGPVADGTRLLVKGQIDLLLIDSNDQGETLTVLDYKLMRNAAPEAYRFQLLTYAAAARAMHKGARLRAGLVLLGARAEPRIFDVEPAEADAALARLGDLAAALGRARQRAVFDGQPLATCKALGCGYAVRCHGGSTPPTSR